METCHPQNSPPLQRHPHRSIQLSTLPRRSLVPSELAETAASMGIQHSASRGSSLRRECRNHPHAIAKSASGAPATRAAPADQKVLDQARANRHRSKTPISVKIVSHFWNMACRRELRWIRSMVSRSGTDPPRVSAQRVMGRRSASARTAASWSRSRSRRGVVLYWSRKASAQASGSCRSSTGQVSERCSPRLRSRLLDFAYRADAAVRRRRSCFARDATVLAGSDAAPASMGMEHSRRSGPLSVRGRSPGA
jgi:hypothetical protein